MKNLISAGAMALLILGTAGFASAQVITGYETAVGPGAASVNAFTSSTPGFTTTETISDATMGAMTEVTNPFALETFFSGSLGDHSTAPVTADVTEKIYLENSADPSGAILVDTINSGMLTSPSLSKPDPFGMGDTLDITEPGTFNEVVYDVSGTLSVGGLLDFQGAFDFDVVPEPSVNALLLCGLGALAFVMKRRLAFNS